MKARIFDSPGQVLADTEKFHTSSIPYTLHAFPVSQWRIFKKNLR
jgi:hypothetical protein